MQKMCRFHMDPERHHISGRHQHVNLLIMHTASAKLYAGLSGFVDVQISAVLLFLHLFTQ